MKRLATILSLLLFVGTVTAQNVIQIPAGQNTLWDAVVAAQPGDILELVTDGGEYLNDDELRIEFPLTIRAADGLTNRPILRHNGTDSTKDLIRLYDSLTLSGVELDGQAGGGSDLEAKYLIRTSDAGDVKQNYNLKVYNSVFRDVVKGSDGNAFRAYGETFADTVLFQNSIFYNTGKEAVRLRDEDSNRPGFGFYNVGYFEVSNSTFYNTKNDAISVYGGDQDPGTPGPKVVIDHVTMHMTGHYGLNLKFVDDATVTNTIIMDNYDVVLETGKTAGTPWLETPATIANSDTLNVSRASGGSWRGGGTPTVTDLLAVDPGFADPANGDFTLTESSPVFGMGTNGSTMGDSRWHPMSGGGGSGLVQVAAGQDALLEAVQNASAGDIIELTTDGGAYENSDELRIQVPLTIRAAAGLTNKPVLTNNGTDSTKDLIRLYDSLTLSGVELDGLAGTSLEAKYLMRTADDGTARSGYVLKVMDSYFHDVIKGSDGNVLRVYKETFADSIIFQNVLVKNTGKEAIRIKDESSNSGAYNVGYFEVSNSTFIDTKAEAIYVYSGDEDAATPGPIVRIDHVTTYNAGFNGRSAIYLRHVDDSQVTNSIFGETVGSSQSVRLSGATASISYSNIWNAGDLELVRDATEGAGMLAVDPMFADAANADLTLAGTSPMRGAGSDGSDLGDARWSGSGTAVTPGEELPSHIQLMQNYPNPFNPATTIPFRLDQTAQVQLAVYDMLGRQVAMLVDGQITPGEHQVSFDASRIPSGTYLYSLTVAGVTTNRYMVLIK